MVGVCDGDTRGSRREYESGGWVCFGKRFRLGHGGAGEEVGAVYVWMSLLVRVGS